MLTLGLAWLLVVLFDLRNDIGGKACIARTMALAMSPYMGRNWSSPNLLGPMGGFGVGGFGYGGPGMLSPYMYGGAYPILYGSMSSYGDPWQYFEPQDLDYMLHMGYINAPQYNQYILMFGERPRRRGMWPFGRCRDWDRFSMGPGIGYGGLGRRGWMDRFGLIPDDRMMGPWAWR